MKNPKDSFLVERLKSIKYSLNGIWYLIKTESSIKIQIFAALIITLAGFYFNISKTEWFAQTLIMSLVLVSESFNTVIEKLADFIHPNYHKKIGLIKDIGAGTVGIAAIMSLIIAGMIYLPKILQLF